MKLEPPPSITSLNLYKLPVHNDTEDIVNFSFLFPCLSWWNETLVQIVCQCNWGHTQKHQSPSSQFSSRSSNNMVLLARKRKVNVWASKHTSVAPLPCFQPLDCELKWFFSFFFHPAWRGGTGDVEWWTGVQALCCSALHWRRSLICIIVPHIKHNPPRTPSHPPPLHPHLTVPPLWLRRLPHGSPHPSS